MNTNHLLVLQEIIQHPQATQRQLASLSGFSLGKINQTVNDLINNGYLGNNSNITSKASKLIYSKSPERAIILAAGYGMRMVPINMEQPKALLKVHGETLIERQIKQLHDVGIHNITIVVGFLKERFEFLVDQYHVHLIVNAKYATHNNLSSLALTTNLLKNAYIIPSDIYFKNNPFSRDELYSWYMFSEKHQPEQEFNVTKHLKITKASSDHQGMVPVGLAYLTDPEASQISQNLIALSQQPENNNSFWEKALVKKRDFIIPAKLIHNNDFTEVNTLEDLRDLDSNTNHLNNLAFRIIEHTLDVNSSDIHNIKVLKKGMTNRSFMFEAAGGKYIMRIPGPGTSVLIDRSEEANVYNVIKGLNFVEPVLYINPQNGYKLTKFLENSRTCDSTNSRDVQRCMNLLRHFHEKNIQVNHTFNLYEEIEKYEQLRDGQPSAYRDYEVTKQNVFSLKSFIENHRHDWTLCHIDANSDNFLFVKKGQHEVLKLIDWEYAGMQDPHLDIAMFAIYAGYNRQQIDQLIEQYFHGPCDRQTHVKIYCYVATAALLWSNWCEYKQTLGIDFGEYSLNQYRYAKEFSRLSHALIKKEEL